MKTKYTVDWFIKFFSAIPARRWTTGVYEDCRGKCCALGHLSKSSYASEEALYNILPQGVVKINDGTDSRYQQKTPRARILAALRAARDNQ